jgi:hypothetical protein
LVIIKFIHDLEVEVETIAMTQAIIPETVRKLLASQPIELPIFHPVALKLQRILSDYDFTVEEVAMVANEDTGLASQMLRMANSPHVYGAHQGGHDPGGCYQTRGPAGDKHIHCSITGHRPLPLRTRFLIDI